MENFALIIENAKEGEFWGRVNFGDNLIVDYASSVRALEKKMRNTLKDFYNLNPEEIVFEILYDTTGLFDDKKYLNISEVAERAGINKSLMRQYAAGIKYPSFERARQIETAVQALGHELIAVRIATKSPKSKLATDRT